MNQANQSHEENQTRVQSVISQLFRYTKPPRNPSTLTIEVIQKQAIVQRLLRLCYPNEP